VEKKKVIIISTGIVLLICVIALGLFLGCQPYPAEKKPKLKEEKGPEIIIDKDKIRAYVKILASENFQGRRAGTEGEAEAALYLAQELKKMDIRPIGKKNTYFQPFPLPATDLKWEGKRLVFYVKDNTSKLVSDNILGLIESSKRPYQYIILSAHYDHLGMWKNKLYPGANDNASGVAAVLEIARFLRTAKELPYSIIIAFWGGEEMGLIGSNFFINNPPLNLANIKLAINLDSIGTGVQNGFLLWNDGPAEITNRLYLDWSKWDNIKLLSQYTSLNSSDHKAIAQAQIPAITILADDWLNGNHTSLDNPVTLNYDKISYLARHIAQYLNSPEIEKLLDN
jgi:hypothetical protein